MSYKMFTYLVTSCIKIPTPKMILFLNLETRAKQKVYILQTTAKKVEMSKGACI